MRVIKVNEESRRDRWILWMLAGTAIGVTAGVLAAEKFSGRNPSAKGLLRRARTLVRTARDQWGPMLTLALELRDAFGSRSTLGARYDDDLEDEDFDVYEDADEYEEAEPPARARARVAALDDDLDEELDDEDLDESEEDAEEDWDEAADDEELDSIDDPLIGRRVLEAFENDPILAERNVEIDADDDAGTVTLYGSVRTPKEVAHAVTLARGVPGVTKVRQQLEVVRRRR